MPYETVREDYLLSNTGLNMDLVQGAISPQLASLPREVLQPLVGVEGAYLDAAFAQMKADYGSIEAYLDKELGVGPAEIAVHETPDAYLALTVLRRMAVVALNYPPTTATLPNAYFPL